MGSFRTNLLCLLALCCANAKADTATLKLQNSQYVSSGATFYREDASGDNSSISLKLQREKRFGKRFQFKGDLKDEYSATENWNYLNVYQAYGQYRPPANITAQFGRKLETWSATEDEWKQGVFQSRFMQNKLRPELAGLTGVFLSSSAGGNLMTVALLPYFVPDTGAHFYVRDHKFTSRNPWFDPPASRYRVGDFSHEIHYSVNKPEVKEVVANPGVAAKIERSIGDAGVRAAAAYKPIPQLMLGFPIENRVVLGNNEDYLHIEITPKVVYHTVYSGDVWAKAGRWSITGGLTYDEPVKDKADRSWIWQAYKPAWIWSALATRPLSEGSFGPSLKLGFLKVDGGLAKDRGDYAGEQSVFEGRFQYDEAYMAGLMLPVRGLFKSAIELESKVVYDRIQNGGVVSLAAGYNFNRDWRVDGEMDLLGLTGERAENTDGFLSTYRANDRFGLGMSYVF